MNTSQQSYQSAIELIVCHCNLAELKIKETKISSPLKDDPPDRLIKRRSEYIHQMP